jgi:hypothetical protein
MARDFGALLGAHVDDVGIALESSGGLLLLGMIIMSLSIISMAIFACSDYGSSTPSKKKSGTPRKKKNRDGVDCGDCGCGPLEVMMTVAVVMVVAVVVAVVVVVEKNGIIHNCFSSPVTNIV